MTVRALLLSILSCAATIPCFGEQSPQPLLVGTITHVTSASDFDVNGRHLHVPETGMILTRVKFGLDPRPGFVEPYLGGSAEVYGRFDKKTKTIDVHQIAIEAPVETTITGSGVVDAVLQPAASGQPQTVRADGYPVLIDSKTKLRFASPLSAATPISTNLWITFRGRQRKDGTVVADTAVLHANTISDGQSRLLDKVEYDPDAVNPQSHQSELRKTFLGYDPKRVPPYPDEAMQRRVRTIGDSLIPRYQRELPDTDDTKIDFRFEVVDEPWLFAVALPSGVILVPRKIVERLKDDSQLAAVLALNMAITLEKQNLRGIPPRDVQIAADLAATASLVKFPGPTLMAGAGAIGTSSEPDIGRRQQNERVSLCLLHDAGYDIYQAPIAWWLLATKEPKDISTVKLPERSAYLYKTLGRTWPRN